MKALVYTGPLGLEMREAPDPVPTPGQALIKVIHDELVRTMGEENRELDLRSQRPVIVLLAGLQGAGKTTTAAKLAHWLIEQQRKSVLLASTDVYRPAAIEQLEQLATKVGAQFETSATSEDPVAITNRAVESARRQGSAGCLRRRARRGGRPRHGR